MILNTRTFHQMGKRVAWEPTEPLVLTTALNKRQLAVRRKPPLCPSPQIRAKEGAGQQCPEAHQELRQTERTAGKVVTPV